MKRSALALVLVVACHAAAPTPPAQMVLHWTYVDATESEGPPWVEVTLTVDGKPIALAHLDGSSDGNTSGAASCVVQNTTATQVELRCGDVPAYQGYLVRLEKQELVIYYESGVDTIDSSDVKHIPARGVASIKVVP